MGFATPATRGFRKGSASSMLDAMTPNQAHPDVNNLGVKLALSMVVVSELEARPVHVVHLHDFQMNARCSEFHRVRSMVYPA